MNVLVTGGAGYIGSALIKKLLEEGHGVFSVDNLSRGDYRYLVKYEGSPRLELVVGDICDLGVVLGVRALLKNVGWMALPK